MTAIEALEAYSSDHAEKIDDLLEWPYRRFLRAFEAWQRRRAVERIERQEDLHIAAMYSNTNMDMADNKREERVQDLRDFYKELRRSVLESGREQPEAPDPQADAFMRAGRRSVAVVAPPSVQASVEDLDLMQHLMDG